MRGAPKTLSCLNAASVLVTAAALIAFSTVSPTAASAKPLVIGSGSEAASTEPGMLPDGTSVAYAVPRNAPTPDTEIVLPQPLPPSAVAQYQRILGMQNEGAYAEADRLIGRLDDTTLIGPVLADRYLATTYRSTSAELLSWFEQYNNQPAAAAIYQMLAKKLPRASLPLTPQFSLLPESTSTLPTGAQPSMGGDNAGWQASFSGGIAAWKRGNLATAQTLFERAAIAGSSDADHAAGAFWAARTALRQQRPEAYLDWLHTAANTGDTFYGMIAGRLLGQGFGPTGIAATLTEADITAVDATPNGHLAFALLQIGESDQAAMALRALWPDMQTSPGLAHAVLAVAARAGLVDVTIAIAGQGLAGGNLADDTESDIAGARLPLPALHPTGGFTIDPALLYAVARTESGFDNNVTSAMGARGLMQLMPVTANYIARAQGISGSTADPSANLAIGQGYIRYLGQQAGIDDNLVAILASYNAGPGAAAAWYNALRDDSDPLVFIETIPNNQTRRFVHQVLADSWIYAEEIGIRPASLDDIAQGNFPQLHESAALASD